MLNRSRKRGDKPWHWICNEHSFHVAILENLPSHNTSCSFRNTRNLQRVCLNRNHKCPAALRITGPSCDMPKLISKQDMKEKGLVAQCSNPWTTYTFTLTPCNSNALYADNTLRNLSCVWHCRRSCVHVMKMRAPQHNHTTADVVLPSEQHMHRVNTRKTRHWKDIFQLLSCHTSSSYFHAWPTRPCLLWRATVRLSPHLPCTPATPLTKLQAAHNLTQNWQVKCRLPKHWEKLILVCHDLWQSLKMRISIYIICQWSSWGLQVRNLQERE